ncbi:putative signal transducing protein [Maribacter luteus]|nr:DUF2007 domain-containing protein [Maribacter luteus]
MKKIEISGIFKVLNAITMKTNYKKIYTGESFVAQQIVSQLHGMGIEAILKDEAESARLAGFASSMLGQVDVYVHKEEVEKANAVVQTT